jgi:hypothetical protein
MAEGQPPSDNTIRRTYPGPRPAHLLKDKASTSKNRHVEGHHRPRVIRTAVASPHEKVHMPLKIEDNPNND